MKKKQISQDDLKITKHINQELLQCNICNNPYDQTTRVPIVACSNCMDVVCLECLNKMDEHSHRRKIDTKCNNCRQILDSTKYKKCYPLVKALSLPHKIRTMQQEYHQNSKGASVPKKREPKKKIQELQKKLDKANKQMLNYEKNMKDMKKQKQTAELNTKIAQQKLKKAQKQLQSNRDEMITLNDYYYHTNRQLQAEVRIKDHQLRIKDEIIKTKDAEIEKLKFQVRALQISISHSA